MSQYDKYNYSKSILNIDIFAPYKWFEMEKLFILNYDEKKIENSACIHWFNGSAISKEFIINFNHLNYESIKNCNFLKIFNSTINNYDKLFFNKLKKKVSIVMAYFNRKKQLYQTIKSIKKSNYKNIEIIIVDDNSDETEKVSTYINKINKNIDIKLIEITEKKKEMD